MAWNHFTSAAFNHVFPSSGHGGFVLCIKRLPRNFVAFSRTLPWQRCNLENRPLCVACMVGWNRVESMPLRLFLVYEKVNSRKKGIPCSLFFVLICYLQAYKFRLFLQYFWEGSQEYLHQWQWFTASFPRKCITILHFLLRKSQISLQTMCWSQTGPQTVHFLNWISKALYIPQLSPPNLCVNAFHLNCVD